MQIHIYSAYHIMRKTLACALLLTAMMLSAQEAQAFVSATSVTKNIAINRTSSVQVTWQIAVVPATPVQVVSNQATFGPVPPGAVLLRVSKQIGGLAVPPTQFSNNALLTVSETVLIPASVIAKARAVGAKQIVYERSFTPGGKGGVTFNITGSASARFSISREALSFTDK